MEEVLSSIQKLSVLQEFTALSEAAFDGLTLKLRRLEKQIEDLSDSAINHEDTLKAQGRSLARLTHCLSQKERGMRSLISQENEKNQQHRLSQNANTIIEFDKRILEMKRWVDLVHQRLDTMQAEHSRMLEATINEQKTALAQIHLKVEESFSEVAKTVEVIQQNVQNATRPNNVPGTANWLSIFARQLVASGITSAGTGAVVLLAIRDKPQKERSSTRSRSSSELDLVKQVQDLSFVPVTSETRKSSSSSHTDSGGSSNCKSEIKKTPVNQASEIARTVETHRSPLSARFFSYWYDTDASIHTPPQACDPSRDSGGPGCRRNGNPTRTLVQSPSTTSSAEYPTIIGRSEHRAQKDAREDVKPTKTSSWLPSTNLRAMSSASVSKDANVVRQAAQRGETFENHSIPRPSKASTAMYPVSIERPLAESLRWLCCCCSYRWSHAKANRCVRCDHYRCSWCQTSTELGTANATCCQTSTESGTANATCCQTSTEPGTANAITLTETTGFVRQSSSIASTRLR